MTALFVCLLVAGLAYGYATANVALLSCALVGVVLLVVVIEAEWHRRRKVRRWHT